MNLIHKGEKVASEDIPQYIADLHKNDWEAWEKELFNFLDEWLSGKKQFEIQTSGSTGLPKKIMVDRDDLIKSARYTLNFLGLNSGDRALLCLPVRFIAGKMMVIRAFTGQMTLECVEPSSDPFKEASGEFDFTAITPHQLEAILAKPSSTDQLKRIANVIIGGAELSRQQIRSIASWSNNVYHTFGMTETLSHVAMSRISGADSNPRLFKSISQDFKLSKKDSRLIIHTPYQHAKSLDTNDLVDIVDEHSFHWLGRADNAINSGGVKIIPEILEQQLESDIKVPFFLAGIKDERLGQRLVCCLLEEDAKKLSKSTLEGIFKKRIKDQLYVPREIIYLKKFLYTDNQKIRRLDSLNKG